MRQFKESYILIGLEVFGPSLKKQIFPRHVVFAESSLTASIKSTYEWIKSLSKIPKTTFLGNFLSHLLTPQNFFSKIKLPQFFYFMTT